MAPNPGPQTGVDETRNLKALPDDETELRRRGRNIIAVIGIDDYSVWRRLHNAVSDAKGVRELFIDKLGFKELVPPLFNADATHQAITSLLQDELATRLEPDDSLVMFFAGHGHTESSRIGSKEVKTGYLMPVEARLPQDHKFSTFIKLDSFLKDMAKLPARHVLLILDACYSGFALGETVQVLRSSDRYSDDLSRRVSRRVITSAMDDQPALDNGPVAGHSLFTGTLIEGVDSGQADSDGKGFVTSSELALYVQNRVSSASQSKQTPDFGSFELDDRGELVISLRGETYNKSQARECLEVAKSIHELGWLADDSKRFQSAVREYRKAIDYAQLAHLPLPEAELGMGKALLAAGDAGSAIKCLGELIRREEESAPPDARFYLGLAYAKNQDHTQAAAGLKGWAERNPDHAEAGWVQAYIQWLEGTHNTTVARKKKALLIGINEYSLDVVQLQGCVNDVARLMQPLLRRWGFIDDDMVLLTDKHATRERVLAELKKLAAGANPEDSVFIHFSGHAVPSSRPDIFGPNDQENVYLILTDTSTAPGHLCNGISAAELHQRIESIPAQRKTLVLDTHASDQLIDMAEREGTYALILASDTAEIAYEWSVDAEGEKLPCGMLTGALYQAGMALPAGGFSFDQWVTPAIRISEQASSDASRYQNRQTPLLVGLKELNVLGGDDFHLPLFEFSQRRQWPELTRSQLTRRYRFFRHLIARPHPQANLAFGQAFLSKGDYGSAADALNRAAEQLGREDRTVLMPLVRAHLGAGDYAQARVACRRLADGAADGEPDALKSLLSQMEALTGSRRHAVLVGIDRYRSRKLPGLKGAVNDAKAMHRVLVERWGFASKDITLLCDKAAHREAILSEFKRLTQISRNETAVFYFAGLGSTDHERLPTIVSHDGRTQGVEDILLSGLAELAGDSASNLIVIIDADLNASPGSRPGDRNVRPDERSARKASSFPSDEDRRRFLKEFRIGAFDILYRADSRNRKPMGTGLPGLPFEPKLQEAEIKIFDEDHAAYHGQLTASLIRFLARTHGLQAVFGDLAKHMQQKQWAEDVSLRASEEILPRPLWQSAAHFELMQQTRKLEPSALRQIIAVLKRAIEQRQKLEDFWPEGRLNAGIACAAAGDHREARRLIEESVEIMEGRGPLEGEHAA